MESGMELEDVNTFSSQHIIGTPVGISFKNLRYNVSMGFRKGRKDILHGVSGCFQPGTLIAIMGPSGAGKSSLLDLLSGFRTTGVEGSVLINGKDRDLKEFRRISCYIQQDDRLQPLLTVQENMQVAADLKLPPSVTRKEKLNSILEILSTLGLAEASGTSAAMLSGGQKKRLSIALELINNPLVMFLDEPTTGLDSSSCSQCLSLLKTLVLQGRTVICTIHQPSAFLFQKFDQVYVLARGKCLYQGSSENMIPYLQSVNLSCPRYHNPADYVIELACGEHGEDKIENLTMASENGQSFKWFNNPGSVCLQQVKDNESRKRNGIAQPKYNCSNSLQATSAWNQICILLRRGFIKMKRDKTLTHMRFHVNVLVGVMLGVLWFQCGEDGGRVMDNYNLLFSILIHLIMSTMMLNILTFPMEMSILTKEHFNRWYSLKSYYIVVNIIDIPVTTICCVVFCAIIYVMSGQPMEFIRFIMFTTISLLSVFISQSIGLMVGAIFSLVNGTFIGPTLNVPMMMFSGFGVNLRDIPSYLKWGTDFSYLRFSLEGYIAAIYGDRDTLACYDFYCHYKYPSKFLKVVAMPGDQFWKAFFVLSGMLLLMRITAYILLRWKIRTQR
uniref:ABC transporter domain-containing protein n=1 Tax=Clastoptera arizonana TaxID=38151 RepID=A0A1B6DAZ1_9HEMI